VCQSSFCGSCWDEQFAHQRNKVGPGGVPHEKTLPSIAEKVRNALEPPTDKTIREKLCREDEVTTWFGKYQYPSDHHSILRLTRNRKTGGLEYPNIPRLW
jgi:hypothetical protein